MPVSGPLLDTGAIRMRAFMAADSLCWRVGIFLLFALGALHLQFALAAEVPAVVPIPKGMVRVPAGVYRPLFRSTSEPREIPVPAFALEICPVTNAEFLEFVRTQPRWRRSQVKRLFADPNYLSAWANDLDPGPAAATNGPVTGVSWFSAKAYAVWRGRRLPSTAEWELAAAASTTRPDGEKDPAFRQQITKWHSLPSPERLPAVGGSPANFYGLQDLHGLVWEWVADFNTAMVTGDARGDTGLERQLFCGSGSQGARDVTDYAAFLRSGFRSSLKASYTVPNLGFRCAQDLSPTPHPTDVLNRPADAP